MILEPNAHGRIIRPADRDRATCRFRSIPATYSDSIPATNSDRIPATHSDLMSARDSDRIPATSFS